MEVDEGGEEDAEDGEEANDEDGVEDVADHFERVLWEYGSDDDELAPAPAQVPTKSRYSPLRTHSGKARN